MRRWILFIVLSCFLGFAFSSPKSLAFQSQYYKMNKQKSEEYIQLSQDAFLAQDYYRATLYAKRAIQEDPWNKDAWENYENILVKVTKGNLNLIPEPYRKKEKKQKASNTDENK